MKFDVIPLIDDPIGFTDILSVISYNRNGITQNDVMYYTVSIEPS